MNSLYLFIGFGLLSIAQAAEPAKAKSAEQLSQTLFEKAATSDAYSNFKLDLEYTAKQATSLKIGPSYKLNLPAGKNTLEVKFQQYQASPQLLSVKQNGETLFTNKPIETGVSSGDTHVAPPNAFPLEGNFTIYTAFSSKSDGVLFMRHDTSGKWKPNGKVLGIKGGKLLYDVGWVGSIESKKSVADGKTHHAVLRGQKGKIELFLDGKKLDSSNKLAVKDTKGHQLQVGLGTNFLGNLKDGKVLELKHWKRSLDKNELKSLGTGAVKEVNTPDFSWSPSPAPKPRSSDWLEGVAVSLSIPDKDFTVHSAKIQPLDIAPHATLIEKLDSKAFKKGEKIYSMLCATCHGNMKVDGSLPTALKFHEGPFKNGADPFRMFKTLEKGYGMMVAQPQYTSEEKYAVIHYIREAFLKKHNPSQYVKVDEDYLKSLPHGIYQKKVDKKPIKDKTPPYLAMDFGPYMMGTFQIDKNIANTAQKGIMIRLDQGKGGVSKGNKWILYDHDTMRVASAFQGDFINWRSILHDGSHGTHVSITGDPILTNANVPMWQNPNTGDWKDERVIGRDGRRYGPLPNEWVSYQGLYRHGNQVIVHYTVGETDIKEIPFLSQDEIFVRQLHVGSRPKELTTLLGLSSEKLHFTLDAPEGFKITEKGGKLFLHFPKGKESAIVNIGFSNKAIKEFKIPAYDIASLTKGGPSSYPEAIITEGKQDEGDAPFLVDEITVPTPEQTPGKVWIRLGGLDFFQNNPDRAAVCTWQGDVWLVDGVAGDLKQLKWRRIATGLFQPLGLKIVDNTIYVTCRDQLARLHDFNGDEEIDYVESFNHDHQVTEHFHEFAMGLQTDDEGNFYYAKSARHAKVAVVPHHGTLLKVTPDGKTTEIIANGFRAANGVCLNPDGTWIVTDQEGHWNPKNRINYVKKGGFYGNMYGYHDVTDSSDEAMEQPLCWITNAFDRSPAELLWVPKDAAWGNLNGTLLNLSYGYGKVYTVPHEIVDGQAQGGMCALPITPTASGIHRARFHPVNKQFYGVGMFAWAGTQRVDSGFYRIRYTGNPAKMPVEVNAKKGVYTIKFSDPVPEKTLFKVKAWDLKRTKNYGSKHYNERELEVSETNIEGSSVHLSIPDLTETRGLEIKCIFPDKSERIIHASINILK